VRWGRLGPLLGSSCCLDEERLSRHVIAPEGERSEREHPHFTDHSFTLRREQRKKGFSRSYLFFGRD
jgi:hypothetical protein